MKRRIAILGSTGSIGTQALEVVKQHPDNFDVEVLTAHSNSPLLIRQAIEFKPNVVVISKESLYQRVFELHWIHWILKFIPEASLNQVVEMDSIDMVLVALVGYGRSEAYAEGDRGWQPVALANKETLVIAGELVTQRAKKASIFTRSIRNIQLFFNALPVNFIILLKKLYLPPQVDHSRGMPHNATKAEGFETSELEYGVQSHHRFGYSHE